MNKADIPESMLKADITVVRDWHDNVLDGGPGIVQIDNIQALMAEVTEAKMEQMEMSLKAQNVLG